MSGVIAAVSTAVVAAATVANYVETKNNAARQIDIANKQAAVQQRQADVANVRRIREAIRASNAAQGSAVNQAASGGVSGSSGAVGGIGSAGTRLSGELNYFSTMAGLGVESNALQLESAVTQAQSSARQGLYSAVGALGELGLKYKKPT